MCSIKTKTTKETVTVYKAVIKNEGKYYAYFSGVEIMKGIVKPQVISDIHREYVKFKSAFLRYLSPEDASYNKIMVGKSSGFANENNAFQLIKNPDKDENCAVLKIKLGGEIWEGDARGIGTEDLNAVVYAGTEILSFKEI
jgi:hypothetical protein